MCCQGHICCCGHHRLVNTVLDVCPSVSDMAEVVGRGEKLQPFLQKKHSLLYPLVRWILISNKAHIRKLLPEEELKSMGSSAQFVLLSSTPEKEKKFRAAREKCAANVARPGPKGAGVGSFFAWHGSAFPNWYALLPFSLCVFVNYLCGCTPVLHGTFTFGT
jgi:hypothetical protein